MLSKAQLETNYLHMKNNYTNDCSFVIWILHLLRNFGRENGSGPISHIPYSLDFIITVNYSFDPLFLILILKQKTLCLKKSKNRVVRNCTSTIESVGNFHIEKIYILEIMNCFQFWLKEYTAYVLRWNRGKNLYFFSYI